jgi:hypothetical protein
VVTAFPGQRVDQSFSQQAGQDRRADHGDREHRKAGKV